MTSAAISVAFWTSAASIIAHVGVLCFKEQPPFARIIDVVFLCISAFIVVGLWPLVLGGGA